MGISGLLPFIKKSTRPCGLGEFSGCTAAVDVYGWLHKGCFGCAEKLAKGEATDGYLLYVMKYVDLLLRYNIKPVLVFDGRNLPSKSVTETKRRESRAKYRELGRGYLRNGDTKRARDCFQRSVDVTPEMALCVIRACRERNVDCLVAPYEADAQLAYLMRSEYVDLVISEDSDLVLYECSAILFKLDLNTGSGTLYEKSKLHLCFGFNADKFDFRKFRLVSITSGCDYLPSLHGIGLAKSLKFWSRTSDPDIRKVLPKMPSYLQMPQLQVTAEYIESFIRANDTFLYQLVYDPVKRVLRPFTDYPEDQLDGCGLEFAGEYVEPDLAFQMALGNVNLSTMKIVDDFDPSSSSKSNGFRSKYGSKTKHPSIWNQNFVVLRKGLHENVEKSNVQGLTKGKLLLAKTAFAPRNETKESVGITEKLPLKDKNDETPFAVEIGDHESPTPLNETDNDKKRKKSSSPSSPKRSKLDSDNDEVGRAYTKVKKKFNFETASTEVETRTVVISKYFAIDSKDRNNERKAERGRKDGGDWLSSLEKSVNHENKFIYKPESQESQESPIKQPKQCEQSDHNYKSKNPFAKPAEQESPKTPVKGLRSPLLNITSPLKQLSPSPPSPYLSAKATTPIKSPLKKLILSPFKKRILSPTEDNCSSKPVIKSSSTSQSPYFNGSRPSGLMKKRLPQQKSLFDCWGKKK